jgi:hypothetical protein
MIQDRAHEQPEFYAFGPAAQDFMRVFPTDGRTTDFFRPFSQGRDFPETNLAH